MMKKYLLLFICSFVFLFTFAACTSKASIIGMWTAEMDDGQQTIYFKEDNTCYFNYDSGKMHITEHSFSTDYYSQDYAGELLFSSDQTEDFTPQNAFGFYYLVDDDILKLFHDQQKTDLVAQYSLRLDSKSLMLDGVSYYYVVKEYENVHVLRD